MAASADGNRLYPCPSLEFSAPAGELTPFPRFAPVEQERSAGDGQMLVHAAATVDGHGARPRKLVESMDEPFREGREGARTFRAGRGFHDRRSGVTPLTNGQLEGDLGEERRLCVGRRLGASARAEYFVALRTTVTDEVALVLDDP